MMNCSHLFMTARLIPVCGFIFLLASCAPTTGIAPSGALKTQLQKITLQQQEQATQLQQLQQQLQQLQEQLTAENIISTQIQGNLETPGQLTAPATASPGSPGQFIPNQEVSSVAASASSYLAAFSNLAAGRPSAAETGFQKFLQDFPGHQYSPNARYWLASAQISQGKTDLAIDNLRQIVINPKGQTKAPAALLQLAQLYRQKGMSIQADNVLEQLRDHYPDSQEAQHFYRSDKPAN